MKTPINPFKQALAQGKTQIGLWLSLAHFMSTEICTGAAFDRLLPDGAHSPNTLSTLLSQLQAVTAYPDTHPVRRLPPGHDESGAALIKQFLDLEFQSRLVPMVDTPVTTCTVY